MRKSESSRRWYTRVIALVVAMTLGAVTTSGADVGWFAGLGVGPTKLNSFRLPTTTIDRSDIAPILFGGYQFHTYFATAAGYIDLGEYHATGPSFGGYTNDIKVNGFLMNGIGILPVGSRVAFLGTLGVYRWDYDFHSSDPFDPNRNLHGTGFSPVLGAGVNYDVHRERHTELFMMWQRYSKVGDRQRVEHENDYDLFMLGASYHIGVGGVD